MAEDVLRQGVQGISDIITTPGMINRDFADVRAIMLGMGFAMMGTATARGENAAVEAARAAIQCPLLEEGGLRGAQAILLNITAPGTLSLHEMHEACKLIREATANDEVQINFGLVSDDTLGDEVKITVIATGFQREDLERVEPTHVSTARSTGQKVVPAVAVTAIPIGPLWEEEELPEMAGADEARAAEMEEEEVFELEAEAIEAEPMETEGVEVEQRAAPAPEPEDALSFEDLDTPAFLRRERKLFQ
jgi:cell division protein FtsZ